MTKSVSLAALFVTLPISSAIAADLPSKKESVSALVAVPVWTGVYAGMNAGGAWGNYNSTNTSIWPTKNLSGYWVHRRS
jgi:outer membrane immunogenic protein